MQMFLLTLCLSLTAFAQHEAQPQKESASDHRSGLQVFHISDLENDQEIWLEKTLSLDYFLRMKGDDGADKIQKISSKDAKQLDTRFASRFIKCQYDLPPSPTGCKVTLRLSMKGETQELCGKDEKKTQEILPFLEELTKRF
jgi:hypothetical protein